MIPRRSARGVTTLTMLTTALLAGGCSDDYGGEWDDYARSSQETMLRDLEESIARLHGSGHVVRTDELTYWFESLPYGTYDNSYDVTTRVLDTSDRGSEATVTIATYQRFHDALFETTSWGRSCASITLTKGGAAARGAFVECPDSTPRKPGPEQPISRRPLDKGDETPLGRTMLKVQRDRTSP